MPSATDKLWATLASGQPIAVTPPAPTVGDLALPEDLSVGEPPRGTLRTARRFLGAWAGSWDDMLPHALLVERAEADGAARAVYAVGDAPAWGIRRAWSRASGAVADGRLVLDLRGVRVSYELDQAGRLLASHLTVDGQLTVGALARVELTFLADPANPLPRPTLGEPVRIPHRAAFAPDGARPLLLEATLYRPQAVGHVAPLAVISHGSSDVVGLQRTLRHDAQARWLLSRGFVVLVPMRRGRGASEGSCGELGTSAAAYRQGLEEAVADLASAVAFGRALPDVDPHRPVLLVGQSRGGLLSVVYAGRHPTEVAGVVNFAGGWTGERCHGAHNAEFLAEAGRGARAAQLWLYGARDSYYGEAHVRANHRAFLRAGGQAMLEVLPVPGDGHRLIAYPGLWRGLADAYLDLQA